jgi:hypothetical protein
MSSKGWLPELLKWNGSDWPNYIEKVFGLFDEGFISSKAMFRGQEVRLRWMPVHEGKPSAFWHLVQEGKIEQDRTPDLRRCERIEWPRAIIDHSDDAAVKVWKMNGVGVVGCNAKCFYGWKKKTSSSCLASAMATFCYLLPTLPIANTPDANSEMNVPLLFRLEIASPAPLTGAGPNTPSTLTPVRVGG